MKRKIIAYLLFGFVIKTEGSWGKYRQQNYPKIFTTHVKQNMPKRTGNFLQKIT